MLTPEQCRAFASDFKRKAQAFDTSKDRSFIMVNIARSLAGLATQLEMLADKVREEARRAPAGGNPLPRSTARRGSALSGRGSEF